MHRGAQNLRTEPDRRDSPRSAQRGHDPDPSTGAQQMRRRELVDMLSTPNMEQRTVGNGRLDPEIARDFSNVGPMVRAPVATPATPADHLFVGYGLLPMEVHSEQADAISRLKVRINEVYTSEYDRISV